MAVKNRVIYGGIIAGSAVLSGGLALLGAKDATGGLPHGLAVGGLGALYGTLNGVAAAACTLFASTLLSGAVGAVVSIPSKAMNMVSGERTPHLNFKKTFKTCFKISSAVIGTTLITYSSLSAYNATSHARLGLQESGSGQPDSNITDITEAAPKKQKMALAPMNGNLAETQIASANFSIEGKQPVRPLDAQHLAAARMRMGRA